MLNPVRGRHWELKIADKVQKICRTDLTWLGKYCKKGYIIVLKNSSEGSEQRGKSHSRTVIKRFRE